MKNLAHFFGRGGAPHLLDHILFGSHQLVPYDELVPLWWVFAPPGPPPRDRR